MPKRNTSTTPRRAANQPRREAVIRFALEGRDRDFRGLARQALTRRTARRHQRPRAA